MYSFSYLWWYMLQKNPGSIGTNDNQSGKPPLPSNAIAELRKGSYYASLELVQSLCDTSYGLVDIFPVEDRKIALREVGQIHYLSATWFFCSWLSAMFPVLLTTHAIVSHVLLLLDSLLWKSIPKSLLLRKMEVIFCCPIRICILLLFIYFSCIFLRYLSCKIAALDEQC